MGERSGLATEYIVAHLVEHFLFFVSLDRIRRRHLEIKNPQVRLRKRIPLPFGSKQGVLKILNRLMESGGLVEVESKSKTKMFSINKEAIKYKNR